MAVIIDASYAKKVGLPQYSSHQYGVSVRLELADLSQLEKANSELYAQLKRAVDSQIDQPGFTPAGPAAPSNGSNGSESAWSCTDRQRELILKLIEEHQLEKHAIEALAQDRFGTGVRQLNRMQASGLIDELIETYGGNGNGTHRRNAPSRRSSR